MSSASEQQQLDIEALLQTMPELSAIYVNALCRGTVEGKIDMILNGSMVPSGKSAGAVLLVSLPRGEDRDKSPAILSTLTHTVHVIEQVDVNRKPGWESNSAKLACGYTFDRLKDLVQQRLHNRQIAGGTLMQYGWEDYRDDRGGLGYDVRFTIVGELASETRNGVRASVSGTTVTITGTGAAGEVMYYTTDGTTPAPGGATVTTYSVPFTASSGTLVRCSSIATGKALSSFFQVRVP